MTINEPALAAETQAFNTGRAFVKLSDWTQVRISGRDRATFMHNFSSNDIKRLTPGASCEAFILNVKGKIVGHGLVLCGDEDLVYCGSPSQGRPIIEHLDRYIIREDVRLDDATAQRAACLVVGDGIPSADEMGLKRPVSRSNWFDSNGSRSVLFCLARDDERELYDALSASRFVEASPESFTAWRIDRGIPIFGVDFEDSNLPQEVGRDRQAISFTKGCYLGQETVARIDALGHVNQRLVGVRFSGKDLPPIGTELLHGSAVVGRVTSTAFSPTLSAPLAMAMVRRGANEVGTQLESAAGKCEVVALPIAAGHS